jgi:hypothetical protein
MQHAWRALQPCDPGAGEGVGFPHTRFLMELGSNSTLTLLVHGITR